MSDDREELESIRSELKDVYNEYRTNVLNKKYYGCRTERYSKINFWFEIIIAVGASGSGVAGFALWQMDWGKYVWACISGCSIILAIVKPIANISGKIEEYAKLYGDFAITALGYESLVKDIRKHAGSIRRTKVLPAETTETLKTLRTKLVELAAKGDKTPHIALAKRMQAEVNVEIPPTALWLP